MMASAPQRPAFATGGTPRLTVTVPGRAAEVVAAYLNHCCGTGVQLRDAETGRADDGCVEVVAWPPADLAPTLVFGLSELFADWRAAGLLGGPTHVELDDDPGLWARPQQVVRIAGRFVIAPPWVPYQAEEGELVVPLDPAGAFGDGRHPSTALALTQLQRVALLEGDPPARVLDVGCGSGVLSLAAALTWPEASVVAVDVSPAAVAAAGANVARLRLERRIDVRQGSVDEVEGPFDLVLANLTAGNLERLAERLAALVRSGGRVVTAGYPLGALDRIERVFIAWELYGVQSDSLEDWAALTFLR